MLVAGLSAQAGEVPGTNGRNAAAPANNPYLILVSIDGFSPDYLSLYPTPALDRIAAAGVRAESLRPVFPSLTFPNHYSIATGLYPSEHGIVSNRFPDETRRSWYKLSDRDSVEDGRWYGGEPIWVTAEKHGLVSAAYYFVGTEAAIQGVRPSHWNSFDASVPGDERVARVVEWLQWPEDRRPHMITLYFEHVDTAGHEFGRGSPELARAVGAVSEAVRKDADALFTF
jgi:predicted AlkP superfamily pyrophosphatase or phosphodiesterase